MARPHLLVTYGPGDRERELFSEYLDEVRRITFLKDLDSARREEALATADVLFAWNPPKELPPQDYARMKKLRFIQLLSAGANHIPYSLIPDDVVIASNVGAFAEPMAEHVLGMVLALAKQLFVQHARLKRGEFDDVSTSRMLHGSVCGILGFGGIGQATARLMRALGARIYAINTSGRSSEPTDFLGTMKDLQHVLEAADIIVVTLPLNRFTKGLIGRRELSWMKTRAILINVARGDIVDETALYEHLVAHPEFLAGIESWWIEPFSHGEFRTNYPFLDLPNFLGCPHNSAKVPGMMIEATRCALANVVRYLKQEPLKGLVRRGDYAA
jgi:phosphoglycerate dehydrogenase-like enzyme